MQVGAKLTGFVINGVDLGSADAYYYGYARNDKRYNQAAQSAKGSG